MQEIPIKDIRSMLTNAKYCTKRCHSGGYNTQIHNKSYYKKNKKMIQRTKKLKTKLKNSTIDKSKEVQKKIVC